MSVTDKIKLRVPQAGLTLRLHSAQASNTRNFTLHSPGFGRTGLTVTGTLPELNRIFMIFTLDLVDYLSDVSMTLEEEVAPNCSEKRFVTSARDARPLRVGGTRCSSRAGACFRCHDRCGSRF